MRFAFFQAFFLFLFLFHYGQGVRAQQTVNIRDETSSGETRPGATVYTYTVQFPGGSVPEFYYDAYDWNVVTTKAYTLAEYTSTSIKIQWLEGPGDATIYYSAQTYSGNFTGSRLVTIGITVDVEVYALPATNVTFDSFVANWNPIPGVSTYVLYVGDETFQYPLYPYNGIYVNGTSQVLSNIINGTYFYRVRAVSGSWSSSYSEPIKVEMFIPSTPTAGSATEITSTSFMPNYDFPYRTDAIQVEVSDDVLFREITTWEYQFVRRAIVGLNPGTTYHYRLKGRTNAGLESGYSNVVSFKTILETPVLNEASEVTPTSFKMSWSSISGSSHYVFEVSLSPEFQQIIAQESVTKTEITIPNLSSGSRYYFRVRAESESVASPFSMHKQVSLPPSPPVAKHASNINTNSFIAEWENSLSASRFRLEVSTAETFNNIILNTIVYSSGYLIKELAPATEYFYRLVAFSNDDVISGYSNIIHTATLPVAPVATFATDIRTNEFVSNWQNVKSSGYLLDVSTDPRFNSFLDGFESLSITELNRKITGLTVRSTYYYRVRAYNQLQMPSAYSNTVVVNDLNHNFIKSATVLKEGVKTLASMEDGSTYDRTISFQFFDGLGRPEQNLIVGGSPTLQDIVQPMVYDKFGRVSKNYLPYSAVSTGWYKSDALRDPLSTLQSQGELYRTGQQFKFYQNQSGISHDAFPFSETIFEASPLNRVVQQGGTGEAWQPAPDNTTSNASKVIKREYLYNKENEVLNFYYDVAIGTLAMDDVTYYDENTLSADKTYDEINHVFIEYKDKEGRLLCKKVQSSKPNEPLAFASTYYIYDDFGNLVVVLPPEGVKKLMSALNLTDPAQ